MSLSSHRSRIKSLNTRMGSQGKQQQQQLIDKLEVVIPQSVTSPSLSKSSVARKRGEPLKVISNINTNAIEQPNNKSNDLKTAQKMKSSASTTESIHNNKNNVKLNHLGPNNNNHYHPIQRNVDYAKPPLQQQQQLRQQPQEKPKYKLVEDKDVPSIIKDYKQRKQYKKLEYLGNGAFARVYKVVTKENEYYAAKVIAKSSINNDKIKSKLLAEINIHRTLKHDNIVKFHRCIEDKHNIYLVLELCENKTLSVMLKNRGGFLTELEVRYYMAQILTALRYMADNRVLHRDLKMSNILLDANMDCKIGDFGLAALLLSKEDRKRTICGTPHYIAPEILFSRNRGHNHKVDMWSAGVIMFNMLFGKQPFDVNGKLNFKQVLQNQYLPQYIYPKETAGNVSKEAKHMINHLLVNDPDERLSVVEALSHAFFQSAIPDHIPKTALFETPSYDSLFKDTTFSNHSKANGDGTNKQTIQNSQSKVALAVQQAKNADHCFYDSDIRPPLNILEETIYDHRSQFPMPSSQPTNSQKHSEEQNQLLTIPRKKPSHSSSISILSKKRSATPIQDTHQQLNKRVRSSGLSDSNNHEEKQADNVNIQSIGESSSSLQQKLEKTTLASQSKSTSIASSKDSVSSNNRPFAIPNPLPHRRPMMEEMAGNLKTMMHRVESLISINQHKPTSSLKEDVEDFHWGLHNCFIETWVDCSKHYGFAYGLSDGTLGFLYNDGSTMTSYNKDQYYYIYHEDNRYLEQEYRIDTVPADLKKKVAVLNKFREYEGPELRKNQQHFIHIPKATELTRIHLFKYFVCEKAIAFRLNNGVVQLNFFHNHQKIVLYDKGMKMLYIDGSSRLSHFNTLDVFKSDKKEMTDALKYTYSILEEQNLLRQNALRKERWKRYEQNQPQP
ncbi:kinase-like domain-containing protein [Mycotypha africana]|uniref:kinase-like domain-containing protein n=1 Tax=Mycotypha africana TaxID=64632 RepID=UPI0023003152|nr:kinase-like domain-containing protein [Mycotypha africana]KAI8970077.1 kinase-like domain-containing protein [Mycotypha africana]